MQRNIATKVFKSPFNNDDPVGYLVVVHNLLSVYKQATLKFVDFRETVKS